MSLLKRQIDVVTVLRYVPKRYTVAVVICLLLTTATPIAASLVTGGLVHAVVQALHGAGGGRAWAMLGAFMAVTLIGWLSGALTGPLTALVARKADRGVRDRLFGLTARAHAFVYLESAEFADDVSRVVTQADGYDHSIGRGAVTQIENLCKVAGALGLCVIIAQVSPIMAALLLLCVFAVRREFIRELENSSTAMDEQTTAQRRGNYLYDLVCTAPASKEIRTFSIGEWVINRYEWEMETYHGAILAIRRGLARREFRLLPLFFAIALVGFLWPGLAALHGRVNTEVITAAVMAITALFKLVQAGQEQLFIPPARLALRALDRIEKSVSSPEGLGTAAVPQADHPPLIRFSGVRFGYDEADVVAGLDLTIRSGEVLAIVGRNGAGKTTLTKLLAGLYQPRQGTITVDGVDLASLDAEQWHRCLAVVFQDFVRYHLPARLNIAPTSSQYADDAVMIRAAIDDAGAAPIVDALPDGWQTPLSRSRSGGVDLSGGQWQKIAIARALFAVQVGARVLVLDEPTAHLDIRAEIGFFSRVVAKAVGTSVVLISHRLSTVRHADRIVLLDGGRIVESGTHEQLLAANGRYAEMFNLQAARFLDSSLPGGER